MTYLYILSNLLFLFCIKKNKTTYTNGFIYVYWGLMLLYPMAIYMAYTMSSLYHVSEEIAILIRNEDIINKVFRTASLALITFGFLMFIKPIKKENQNTVQTYSIKGYQCLYFILFPIALYLNSITNWTTDREGLLPSLAAYSRNLMTVTTVILILPRNVSILKKLLFICLFMVITFASTQRTNALIVIIAVIYTLKSSKSALRLFFIGILSLLILGSLRNGISATNLIYPILGEGLFGGWGLLQAIDTIDQSVSAFDQILMPFNELINWFFHLIHIPFILPTLSDVVTKTGVVYYPMGGFFYLSDAYLMHPIIGPILYTGLIYLIYYKCVNKFYTKHTPLSLICLSLLFDAVKGSLCVFTVMLLFHVICYYIVIMIVKHKIRYPLRNSLIESRNNKKIINIL